MSWIEGVFSGPGAQLGQMSHTRHATHSAQYFFSHVTSFEKFRSFLSILTTKNNDQCPRLPGKNIRKNPMIPRSPTPFVLSYGFNLTEPRNCVTRIAILASHFLRTAERMPRPLSSARVAEAPDGLTHRCLLSGFFQTVLARPTFSWELLSNLFGLVFSQSRHSW